MTAPEELLDQVSFDSHGLVPVVVQEADSGQVLMLAYANREALALALEKGQGVYWSRRRQEIWVKGATSGNRQQLVEARLDCDGDAVLYLVKQSGPACHRGTLSCFDQREEKP